MQARPHIMMETAGEFGEPQAALLRVEGLRVLYGRREALVSVSLEAAPGSVTLLTGRNGAGKSTLLKAVSGAVMPAGGRVLLGGRDITGSKPHENARRGIAYLAQGGAVFPELTVIENLDVARLYLNGAARHRAVSLPGRTGGAASQARMGAAGKRLPALETAPAPDGEPADPLESFPALIALAKRPAGLLSGGERQMLALAMCLSRQAELLLLDEPTAGLTEELARQTLALVRKACETTGCAAIVAEQNVAVARRVADVEYALAAGRIVSTTRPQGGNPL